MAVLQITGCYYHNFHCLRVRIVLVVYYVTDDGITTFATWNGIKAYVSTVGTLPATTSAVMGGTPANNCNSCSRKHQ